MRTLFRSATALALAFFSATLVRAAEPAGPKVFDSPRAAAEAAVHAAQADDAAGLLAIFGPEGKAIVSSGDAVDDKNDRAKFAESARKKMDVVADPANPKQYVVVVGDDDWPLPVPIVGSKGKWHVDAKQGRQEILARRIGGNELDAIALLRGYVEAQKDYASQIHDGSGMHQYAQKVLSSPGKQDGLSWKNADGSVGGPMGDVVAKAIATGHTNRAEPYNGYYFRTLTGQGPAARLGARNYIVQGMMIGGFAAIAWPATYDVTGIQTFMVNSDGLVYQKDLGPETSKIAPGIKLFNPNKTWAITEDEP
jgi:hypothetical protein